MVDWIVVGIIALIIGGALAYIIKAKKSGKKCIGCPDSGSCGSQGGCSGCSGSCHCHEEQKEN
ncbi:MAG: FeoB-associated Cys-rich membrane protein [Clostridia bacterium]|nr:FeoB-associated Cys-rich membrane protein [Clostridia bacterium]